MAIHVNQRVRLKATFKNESGTLANPTSVTCRLRSPAGTITAPVATNPSTGIWQFETVVTTSGNWRAEFVGSGAIEAAESMTFYVEPSEVDR